MKSNGAFHLSSGDLDDLRARFFRDLAGTGLNRSDTDLDGAVLSHVELAAHRPPGTALVRVLRPTTWSADGHVVVEIVVDDMPFLVDSITALLVDEGFGIDRVIHPLVVVERDPKGDLLSVRPEVEPLTFRGGRGLVRESWMHVEIDDVDDPELLDQLAESITAILDQVRDCVEDWPEMERRARDVVAELRRQPPPISATQVMDTSELMAWLADGHFTFLGYREYLLTESDRGEAALAAVPGTGLGLMRDHGDTAPRVLPPVAASKATEPELLIITKANSRSTVHRRVYLDYIGIKMFDAKGIVIGERRFLGLFTSVAYTESVTHIPLLRTKVAGVLDLLGHDVQSHSGKALSDILETYPRDELFQSSVEELAKIANAVLHLRERRELRLFVRREAYGRFVSFLVYLPRDGYNTDVRLKVQSILAEAVGGNPTIDYTTWVTESVLARLHFVIRPERGHAIPDVDAPALEQRLRDATRTWKEAFAEAVDAQLGETSTTKVVRTYGDAFSEAYKEDFDASTAVEDVRHLMAGGDGEFLSVACQPTEPGAMRFKIYRSGPPLTLSAVLPLLTSTGVEVVDERPYSMHLADRKAWIYDFGLRGIGADSSEQRERFKDAFMAGWHGDAETDGLNRLVVEAGLSWRDVVILRAYTKYLRQANLPFSPGFIESTLLADPTIGRLLVDLFIARFAPEGDDLDAHSVSRTERIEAIEADLEAALDAVASLDQDRALRALRSLIRATLRTNAFQLDADGRHKSYVSLKFDAPSIDELPEPKPKFEIFCYSPRVEGVHLRFGPVARGGLRWSDRREDFRTEVLGLVKAQMVKNTVIVPVGSKGGFYAKNLPDPSDRDAWLTEGKASYRLFISSLLDLTDNRVGGAVVPPPQVVRWDGDDPYLVVAADKGTATFSDLANEVSAQYGFWLGDAFASGGSVGYDHKAMGITARGAWVSVQRHFREMGIDCQREDFTCVGIGDMSGDVFGNGMLLSEHIKLVAAFDHRHVFIDPDPDPAASFAERQRMFALARSSWADYDASLISEGGGVFPRSAKSIPLNDRIRGALGIAKDVEAMSPPELLSAILTAPVDLLWNGGIGTYVKAHDESHDEVGDKANNAIRVDGRQLRCRSVAEGGNLGLTQRGRIEYARFGGPERSGGRINTDFIDNSAGVDTSDHEVNIKILLDQVVAAGHLTVNKRNALLPQMTDEVADLVLADNEEQNLALISAGHDAASLLHVHASWMTHLERQGLLNRAIEFLPTDEELAERQAAGIGLTQPELAVLLAYSKIVLADRLIDSALPDEPYFARHLATYFPTLIREKFADAIGGHPLRREIIVTAMVNELVNHAGLSYVHRMAGETGADLSELVRAHAAATDVLEVEQVRAEITALDNLVEAAVQSELRLIVEAVTERVARWFINHGLSHDVDVTVARFGAGVHELFAEWNEVVAGREHEAYTRQRASFIEAGVPEDLASRVAALSQASGAAALVDVANALGEPVGVAARVNFEVAQRLGLDRLAQRIASLPRDDRWRATARATLREDLRDAQTALVHRLLTDTDAAEGPDTRVKVWAGQHRSEIGRVRGSLEEVWHEETADLARLSVGVRFVRSLLTQHVQ